MSYDASLPFVPGFWVPACAGMTGLAVMTVGVSGMTMGVCLNRGLRRFSQMGYDAPLPFVPGFWVPACAGMT